MKLSNKYIAFAGVALLMASCDLDKFPEGDYISEEQKEDIINGRPNLITAEVNAMAAKSCPPDSNIIDTAGIP